MCVNGTVSKFELCTRARASYQEPVFFYHYVLFFQEFIIFTDRKTIARNIFVFSDHKWLITAFLFASCVFISTQANDNNLRDIVQSVSDQNQKPKTSSEEVVVETEDESTPPESLVKYSEQIHDGDPASAVRILTAPDLSQPDDHSEDKESDKNKHTIKHIDSFPNFGKFILDNEPWVENFISKVEEASYSGTLKRSLESNTSEDDEIDNDAESQKKLEAEMTADQLEGKS